MSEFSHELGFMVVSRSQVTGTATTHGAERKRGEGRETRPRPQGCHGAKRCQQKRILLIGRPGGHF